MEKALDKELEFIAKSLAIKLSEGSVADKFKELIIKLSQKEQVAIIIDEYDKPIIDYIGEEAEPGKTKTKATENRDILKNFYSVLKDLDSYIRFFFVTGVSKFSRVSNFSDLNNLIDITVDPEYSTITGWSKEELVQYFPDYIKEASEKYKNHYSDIMEPIKEWYNGYSWDGENFVYNPVSIMRFFSTKLFQNFWFATGTPTFLIKFIRQRNVLPYKIEESTVPTSVLEKYEIDNLTLIPLLFQTGYLTIKKYDILKDEFTLGYPNREVAKSFSEHILAEHTTGKFDVAGSLVVDIRKNFELGNIQAFIENLNALFSGISYTLVEKTEAYFHSLFYLTLRIMGYNIETEILTIKGRIDAVIKSETHIYIIEFKINQSAEKAIEQIRAMNYADKYKADKRKIMLLGINLDVENKNVDDCLCVEI